MPVVRHDIASQGPAKVWKTVYDADKKNFIMTASCKRANDGLTADHAYTLVSAYKLNVSGEEHHLVKMRNPWGTEGYNGTWSDKDSRWTTALRK